MPASNAKHHSTREPATSEPARLERRYAEIGIPAVAAAARFQGPDPAPAHAWAEQPRPSHGKQPVQRPDRS